VRSRLRGARRSLAEELGAGAATLSASPATPAAAPTPRYSKANPFPAQLTENRRLNPENPGKETRHLALSLIGSGLAYEAGDSVGLWPRNDPALVTEVLALTGLDERVPVTVKGMGETSLGEALLRHYEIARPSPDALSLIAARTSDASLRASLAPERKSALRDWLWGRQLADVLHEFPVRLDADELLAALRPLQPRSYSIASSPKLFQQEVHLTLSTVRYACGARRRGGVCSAYLADRALDAPVPLFIQRSSGFRPPASSDTPMIMVGPGTGIAPFRAFLQERQALGARGRNWLFFGEQHAASDFYYRDELERMLDEGALTHLSTAFSRDQAAKIYVQDRMLERGGELWAWLQDGAHVYVCGDAIRMARDVDETLREIAQAHGGMSPEAAKAYFAELSVAKRYVRDVY
jgi:sulfite reductase (NADPH) flavoprotein alpha-component